MCKPILSYQGALLSHKYILKINCLLKRPLIDSILCNLKGIQRTHSLALHSKFRSHTYKETVSLRTLASSAGNGGLLKSASQELDVQGSFLSEYQQVCSAAFLFPYNAPF